MAVAVRSTESRIVGQHFFFILKKMNRVPQFLSSLAFLKITKLANAVLSAVITLY